MTSREGYMCKVDFDIELDSVSNGTKVFASIEDLRRNYTCTDQCGIVKVKVELIEVVQKRR